MTLIRVHPEFEKFLKGIQKQVEKEFGRPISQSNMTFIIANNMRYQKMKINPLILKKIRKSRRKIYIDF